MKEPAPQNGGYGLEAKEEILMNLFSPIEPIIMRIQSLLVWENPKRSAVMVVCLHILFWFLAVTTYSFYFLVSFTTLVVYFTHTWKTKIWPEIKAAVRWIVFRRPFTWVFRLCQYFYRLASRIRSRSVSKGRVPPTEPEDVDGALPENVDIGSWTPLHPRLLNVRELCHHVAGFWNASDISFKSWIEFRREHRYLFLFWSCLLFLSLTFVGHYVPGIVLSYVLTLSLFLCPCALYHRVLHKCYLKFEPFFMRIDYSMKSRQYSKGQNTTDLGHTGTAGDVPEDLDSDMEDFIPDPEATAALARAITDSEDESLSQSGNSPLLSKEPSISNSDIDSRSDVDFENGLDTMPSFDDNLDHSCDELELPDPTRSERGEGSLKFVSSHFQDDYDSDDDPTLTRDLEFPDVSEVSQDAQRNEQSNDKLASIAVALVSKTLSSAMTTALQSFGQDREGDASVDHPVIFKTGGDSDSDEIDVNPDVDSGSETDGEDFEFLDKSDLEHYENKSK